VKTLRRGALIAIEGIDGAGKTTQAHRLQEYLIASGYDAIYLKEPTSGIYGQQIRMLAIHGRDLDRPETEHELFLADRTEDVENNILPSLREGKIVIMDRYYISNICYQGVLGLNPQKIKSDNEEFAPKPDLVILLDIAPRVGIRRIIEKRKETNNHFEKENYLNKVKNLFDILNEPYIQRISGAGSIIDVAQAVQNTVMSFLRRDEDCEPNNVREDCKRDRKIS